MNAHFFDIDVILKINAQVWLVDKTKPNIPIMKISKPEFNLIRSGVWKSHGNLIKFGNDQYWIPTDMFNNIKILSKRYRADLANLAFSMQEFMNRELIENLEYDINLDNILHLKNTDDHIYIICSRNSKNNYESIISKIEDKLKDQGLQINKFYFISETFYNRKSDNIAHKKVRLLLQHLVGYKTESDKFIDYQLDKYDQIYYYDDEDISIQLAIDSNKFLMILLFNTDDNIKEDIREDLKSQKHTIWVNDVTGNRVNKFITTKVEIQYSNLIKKFESFSYYPKYR